MEKTGKPRERRYVKLNCACNGSKGLTAYNIQFVLMTLNKVTRTHRWLSYTLVSTSPLPHSIGWPLKKRLPLDGLKPG